MPPSARRTLSDSWHYCRSPLHILSRCAFMRICTHLPCGGQQTNGVRFSGFLQVALHSQCCAVLYAMSHSGPLALLFLRNVIDSSLPALHVSKLLPTLPGPSAWSLCANDMTEVCEVVSLHLAPPCAYLPTSSCARRSSPVDVVFESGTRLGGPRSARPRAARGTATRPPGGRGGRRERVSERASELPPGPTARSRRLWRCTRRHSRPA